MRVRALRIGLLICLLVGLTAATGCSRGQLQEVSDSTSWFHVRVPSNWQTQVDANSMLLYAEDELPKNEDEAFDTLSILVLSSANESSTPVAKELPALVRARAASRGWTSTKVGTPKKVKIGGREAYAVDVTASDAKKRPFGARIALVRTNGRDALVVGLAPADRWKKDQGRLDDLFGEWYWHQSE